MIVVEWYEVIAESLSNYQTSSIRALGGEILCKTEEAANTVADMIERLYRAQGEEVLLRTGYYDPNDDEESGETDEYTGWWYIDME